uniref:Uncharacterized protein n=1 Tax=Rhizophora mucronata TaxID=61149 RepID=A0A2P2N9D7_RHIMU
MQNPVRRDYAKLNSTKPITQNN